LREELTRALSEHDLMDVAPQPPPGGNDPHAWFLGRSFGGFRILCALASGGMATVFLARKEGPSRVSKYAAIKVVHPHLAFETDFVNMFLDEARIAAVLDHPNVCRVIDFGMAEGTYYLAMEYLLGETWSAVRAALADRPDAARVLPSISAYVLSQACEGLHAAHEAVDEHGRPLHIVHRDVSPQNIFVAYDGTVRVLDFGIARAADRITSTRDGTLKGRLAYMSPEQMSGLPVGASADIWAMGVVLREALEGKRLFRRTTDAETMLAVTHEPLPGWSLTAPAALRAIAERALSREPLERFASAHEMATELWRFAQSARTPVGSSELSAWMALLFAAQLEQKRALLQLPVPTPVADAALPWPAVLPPEPSLDPSLRARGSTLPAPARQRRTSTLRPRWVNLSALLALASVGAIAGLLLGRIFRSPPRDPAPAAAPVIEPLPSVSELPRVEPLPGAVPAPEVAQVEPAPAPQAAPAAPPPEPEVAPEPDAHAPYVPGSSESEPAERARGHQRARRSTAAQGAAVAEARAGADGSQRPSDSSSRNAPSAPAGAAEKAASEPSASGETGTVAVAFEGGWAEVYLGTRLLGTTPGRFTLPAGKHTLTVRPFGTGKPLAKRVEVSPGTTQKLFLGPSSL
ncbi:MAG TPA: serine/threonine-protein kinase, partial [Polyangiales bacterium]